MVTVAGELDHATAPPLQAFLTAEIESCGRDMILDLRGLDFLGAAGLTAFVVARAALAADDREIAIMCDRPRIRRLFLMCELHDALGLHGMAPTG
jgi:anti-sigma B factor antagonist